MGRLKPLLPWGDRPLVVWQIEQMKAAGVAKVVVVLGNAAEAITGAIASAGVEAEIVVNEAFRDGRASSLRRGAQALSEGSGAILILGVDQPRPAWIFEKLISDWREEMPLILQPGYKDRGGHPVLVSGGLLEELRRVTDADLGLRAVLVRHGDELRTLGFASPAVLADLNTESEYRGALAAWTAGEWQEGGI